MTIDEVLTCLEANRQRATYRAVAEATNYGGGARNVRLLLIDWSKRHNRLDRNVTTSWVVNQNTGWPTGYDENPSAKVHPDLEQRPYVFETGDEILRLWSGRNPTPLQRGPTSSRSR